MIPLNMTRPALTLALAIFAVLAMTACSGDDDDYAPSGSLSAGQITCEQLFNRSYQYSISVKQTIGPVPTTDPMPSGGVRQPFELTQQVTNGKVQDGVNLQATVQNTLDANDTVYEAIQIGMNDGYLKFDDDSGWKHHDTSTRRIPFPYWPMSLCDSLSLSMDTTKYGDPVTEDVRGTRSEKYVIDEIDNTVIARSPDFGPGSDLVSYIPTLSGTLWVAQTGRYPTKFELSGQGAYPSGQSLSVQLTWEVWDMGGKISVKAPPLGPQ